MTTTLRRVLQAFEDTDSAVSLQALGHRLGLEPGTLDNMIAYWVRKGRIKEVNVSPGNTACYTCDIEHGCPFAARMPRRYMLVQDEEAQHAGECACGCGTSRR